MVIYCSCFLFFGDLLGLLVFISCFYFFVLVYRGFNVTRDVYVNDWVVTLLRIMKHTAPFLFFFYVRKFKCEKKSPTKLPPFFLLFLFFLVLSFCIALDGWLFRYIKSISFLSCYIRLILVISPAWCLFYMY